MKELKEYKIVMFSVDGIKTMASFGKLETAKNVFETVFKNSASETRSYSLIECSDNRETVLDSTKTKKE